MLERITKIRDQITEKGTQAGKTYKLNAKDVQFMQSMQDEDTPVEPKAAKGKKETQASAAPAAVDDDVAKTAGWLVENAVVVPAVAVPAVAAPAVVVPAVAVPAVAVPALYRDWETDRKAHV